MTATTTHDTKTSAAGLLASLRGKHFRATVSALLDLFEECGRESAVRPLAHYRRSKDSYRHKRGVQESFERAAVEAGLAGWDDWPSQQEALPLPQRLAEIAPRAVAVVSAERRPGRRELAAMA